MILTCLDCPIEFEYDRPITNGRKGRYPIRCNDCRKEYARTYDKNRRKNTDRVEYFAALRLRTYGLTQEQYDAMLEQQDNLCAVCHEGKPTHIDHDHACCPKKAMSCGKCVRGVLCRDCNIMLGVAKDNKKTLTNAVNYLESSMRL